MASSPATVGAVEHGQSLIMDQNLSSHCLVEKVRKDEAAVGETNSLLGLHNGGCPGLTRYYSDLYPYKNKTIRFQVVFWYVGAVDVIQRRIPVTFRVTMFWNETVPSDQEEDKDTPVGLDTNDSTGSAAARTVWKMRGRQTAVQTELSDLPTIDVPPLSILNVATFDTIGEPEVSLLRQDVQLWRWTCMYRATLVQQDWNLHNFPHDQHDISLKLAVLAHRKPGGRWDRRIWKLAPATPSDSQGSTRVPFGLVVDEVEVPEFSYNKEEGLVFEFLPLEHGPGGGTLYQNRADQETYLTVKLRVTRDSSYYDRNIVPLLGFLNFVAISVTGLPDKDFFERGLILLDIAFVEIGIRLTTDKHLPSVPYQIKMQRILNEYFYCLLFLVVESNVVYELHRGGYSGSLTRAIDWLAILSVIFHNAWTLFWYYKDAARMRRELARIPNDNSGWDREVVV